MMIMERGGLADDRSTHEVETYAHDNGADDTMMVIMIPTNSVHPFLRPQLFHSSSPRQYQIHVKLSTKARRFQHLPSHSLPKKDQTQASLR